MTYEYKRVNKHRLVYEIYNKCELLPWVDIHHIDGNKQNNDISNLQPLLHGKHSSITQKGRPESEATKIKMSQVRLGHTPWNKGKTGIYSDETRKRISNRLRGKHLSDETKKLISDRLRGRHWIWPENSKLNISILRKGRKMSEETKEKIRRKMIGNKNQSKNKIKNL